MVKNLKEKGLDVYQILKGSQCELKHTQQLTCPESYESHSQDFRQRFDMHKWKLSLITYENMLERTRVEGKEITTRP